MSGPGIHVTLNRPWTTTSCQSSVHGLPVDKGLRTRVYGLRIQGRSTDFNGQSLRAPAGKVYGLQSGQCESTDSRQMLIVFLGANINKLTFILNPPSSSSSRHRRCQAMATNKDNDRRARRERGRDYERRRDDDKKK